MDHNSVNTDDSTPSREGAATSTRRPTNRGKFRPYGRGRHRPRLDKEPAYTKQVLPISLSMSPVKTFHALYTSSNGIPRIAEVVYSCLQSRVKSLAHDITLPMFKYVVALAWYGRLTQINKQSGLNMHIESTALIEVAYTLPLPHIICKYIEALGEVTLLNGLSVIPYCNTYRTMIPLGSEHYYDPLEALQDAGRPEINEEWSLDRIWIHDYVQAVGRFDQISVEFRTITRDHTGLSELLIGTMQGPTGIIPISPERQTQAVAALGACYAFRDYDQREDWPFGDNHIIPIAYTSTVVDPNHYIACLFNGTMCKEV